MADSSTQVALYASVGPQLTHYAVDVEGAALERRATVTLPANIHYCWPHASGRYLYVASSDSASGVGGFVGRSRNAGRTRQTETSQKRYRETNVVHGRKLSAHRPGGKGERDRERFPRCKTSRIEPLNRRKKAPKIWDGQRGFLGPFLIFVRPKSLGRFMENENQEKENCACPDWD